jgi:hypothetical protein
MKSAGARCTPNDSARSIDFQKTGRRNLRAWSTQKRSVYFALLIWTSGPWKNIQAGGLTVWTHLKSRESFPFFNLVNGEESECNDSPAAGVEAQSGPCSTKALCAELNC